MGIARENGTTERQSEESIKQEQEQTNASMWRVRESKENIYIHFAHSHTVCPRNGGTETQRKIGLFFFFLFERGFHLAVSARIFRGFEEDR